MGGVGQQQPSKTGSRGGIGCLFALVLLGSSFVLLLLGLRAATREVLPVAPAVFLLALIWAAFSYRGFRRWLTGLSSHSTDSVDPQGAIGAGAPPRAVTCANCGGAAPLCVFQPNQSTCGYCGHTFALPPALGASLERAAADLNRRSAADRQMNAAVAALSSRFRALRWLLALMLLPMGFVALLMITYGWWVMESESSWYGWVFSGIGGAAVVAALAVGAAILVPAGLARMLNRWKAQPLGGQRGLACRVCGGPLPDQLEPVLRCGYCSADNLAGQQVLLALKADAGRAERSALSVNFGRSAADDVVAWTLLGYPLVSLFLWFSVMALGGTVLPSLFSDVEIPADASQRYVLVRIDSSGELQSCLAHVHRDANGRSLDFGGAPARRFSAQDLARYQVGPELTPDALVGKRLAAPGASASAPVEAVVRRLSAMQVPIARLTNGERIYLPRLAPGGSSTCVADNPPAAGPALSDVF